MSSYLRARRDVIDLRPIRIHQGPYSYSYRWKLMALLDLNDKGEFILPFSRRVVHIDSLLWPRSHQQPPPPGYELCGCNGCETKSYADHILKDDNDDDHLEYGNLHIEEIHIESVTEKDDNENKTSDDDNDNSGIMEFEVSSSSIMTTTSIEDDDNYEDDHSFGSVSDPPSPFACDPYESFDFEC